MTLRAQSSVAFGGRIYLIRPAGVLGPRERRELLATYAKCDAYAAIPNPSELEAIRYLTLLRDLARLVLVGVPDRVVRHARREELLEIRRAYERVSFADAELVIAAAPGVRDRYASELERIKKKVVDPTMEVP